MVIKYDTKLKYLTLVLLLLALSAFFYFIGQRGNYFEVVAVNDEEVIFRAKVKPGDTFSTTFKHSVQLSDWTDYFEITEQLAFRLYETHFSDFGWGFPSEPDPGAKMEVTDKYVRYYDMNRIMVSFRVAVTTANDRHFMMMGDSLVDFVKEAGPGRLLEFRIR